MAAEDGDVKQPPAAVEVQAAVQNYEWGVRGGGNNGLVARMARAPRSDGTPFAELWMGTHRKAPLTVVDANMSVTPGTKLSDFLRAYPAFAGEKSVATYADQLPYLFKCLSVDKALSIQAHPNKQLAKQLHTRDPKNYPDDNHKPELACAVTDFEGLCGFRPLADISQHVASFPELQALIPDEVVRQLHEVAQQMGGGGGGEEREVLRAAFAALMRADPAAITTQAEVMVARLGSKAAGALSTTERLILRINAQFPGDVGLFNILFLNHCVLRPGEALFLGPNLPHAYISGDCMEIMATSDNVVRAGFTPKFKDVDTLVGMLEYTCGEAPVLAGDIEAAGLVRLYKAPGEDVPEFALRQVALKCGETVTLAPSVAPRTLICLSGAPVALDAPGCPGLAASSRIMDPSTVVVVGAGSELTLSSTRAPATTASSSSSSPPNGAADATSLVFVASCHPCFEL